jgi:DinB superfamily
MTIEQRQYPIGKWESKEIYSAEEIQQNLSDMVMYAQKYSELTAHLSDEDLAKTYREGSWTIRQIVHHVADTQLWHYIRLKQTLAEENPTGIFVNVNALVTLADYETAIADSLQMIKGAHTRYAILFASVSASDHSKTYYHPHRKINVTMPQGLDMALWHAKHHYHHICIALEAA